jgi:hypothetical protein
MAMMPPGGWHPGSGPAPGMTPPEPGGPAVGGTPGSAVGPAALLRATYQAILKAKGVPHLAADDPGVLMLYQAIGGLTPQQALAASQRASSYARDRGYAMSDAELNGMLAEVRGPMTGAETSPLVGVGAQIRQDYDALLGQRGVSSLGADDPQLLAAIQGRVPGLTAQQARQVAQQGRDWYERTGTVIPDAAVDRIAGQAKGFTIPLPHQFDPARWDAVMADPVGAGLFEATVRGAGWDWDTYKRQHLAARPTGTAARSTGATFSQPQGVWG